MFEGRKVSEVEFPEGSEFFAKEFDVFVSVPGAGLFVCRDGSLLPYPAGSLFDPESSSMVVPSTEAYFRKESEPATSNS